jgi:hypothetical protein
MVNLMLCEFHLDFRKYLKILNKSIFNSEINNKVRYSCGNNYESSI